MQATPFVSTSAAILYETLRIRPTAGFRSVEVEAEYKIQVTDEGIGVPMLFVAPDYATDFIAYLDGQPLASGLLPDEYYSELPDSLDLSGFDYLRNKEDGVQVRFDTMHDYYRYRLDDLRYFEADFTPGVHTLRITYTADPWTDEDGWVVKRSFRYSLSPARYWSSFGGLRVEWDGTAVADLPLRTNLPTPKVGNLSSEAVWEFGNLPDDWVQFEYVPDIPARASSLINFGPDAVLWSVLIVLGLLNVLMIYRHRRNYYRGRISYWAIVGAMVVPLLACVAYAYTFELISDSIGEDASNQFSYGVTFVFLLFLPVAFIVYLIIMLLVDVVVRQVVRVRKPE